MVEYTIDDIRGPTVAREMAQLKEFVLEKFNGAIADAEAAAAAAATAAANAVIGSLTSRVTALEGDMTTAQGDIVTNANAILALDGAVVKLTGAQTITGIKDVPLEATGTASNQIASSQKVKNELDNYAPMVRNTGNMDVAGIKTLTTSEGLRAITTNNFNNLIFGSTSVYNYLVGRKYNADRSLYDAVFDLGCFYNTSTSTWMRIQLHSPKAVLGDADEKQLKVRLCLRANNDDTCSVYLEAEKKNGTSVSKILGTFDGTTWS